MSTSDIAHTGHCFCRAVGYKVTGKSTFTAYCHCTLCQRQNGAAFVATLHFSKSNFSWTHTDTTSHDSDVSQPPGLDQYEVSSKPWKKRHRCKICGCTVASYNSKSEQWSVWGVQLDRDEYGKIVGWEDIKPTAHIFYETRLVDVKDDLGKWTGYEGKSERIG